MAARIKKGDGLSVAWERRGCYPVLFAEDVFAEGNPAFANLLRELTGVEAPRVMMVADGNVVQRTTGLGTRIGRYVQTYGITLAGAPVVLGGGEKLKTDQLQSVMKIVTAALDAKIGVADVVLALGGGAVLDVAGYAACQVRGGAKLVRIPTTVAAMLDAAFAEEAALNSPAVKNAVRIPCPPAAVVIDPAFAATVLDGVWRGGIGEAVRQAAVRDGALMKKLAKAAEALKNREMAALAEIVRACAESRVRKGGSDFALWSAHRLEAMSGYKLPHGYAVPMGICIDCAYAVEKGIMKEEDQETICRVLADCGALDGLAHSRHLMTQPDNILFGLDAWRLATGREAILVPAGVGKAQEVETPDREALKKVIKEFHDVSAGS
ncbi:MAG: iron-containing alcohol dehydrogenase [Kiritimatiellia bacterium]